MKNIREMNGGDLAWIQPHATKRVFELRSGEEILSKLQWKSSFGSLAHAEAGDGHWTFKRTGFFSPQITVRNPKSDSNIAVFIPNWRGEGSLNFSDGRCFRWLGIGFWHSQWTFAKASGEHLIYFEPKSSFLKRTAVVKVVPDCIQIPELSLLILVGWYLMILRSDDEAATGAAAASSAS